MIRCELAATRARGRTFYEPLIEYTYDVEGRAYVGSTIRLDGSPRTFLARPATQLCRRHPFGARVEVWYDPARPERSCLELGEPVSPLVVLAAVSAAAFVVLVLARALTA